MTGEISLGNVLAIAAFLLGLFVQYRASAERMARLENKIAQFETRIDVLWQKFMER